MILPNLLFGPRFRLRKERTKWWCRIRQGELLKIRCRLDALAQFMFRCRLYLRKIPILGWSRKRNCQSSKIQIPSKCILGWRCLKYFGLMVVNLRVLSQPQLWTCNASPWPLHPATKRSDPTYVSCFAILRPYQAKFRRRPENSDKILARPGKQRIAFIDFRLLNWWHSRVNPARSCRSKISHLRLARSTSCKTSQI